MTNITVPVQFIVSLALQAFIAAMAVTVYFFNRKSPENRYFALFLATLHAWSVTGLMYMYFPVPAYAWVAAQMMAGIFFGPTFYLFARSLAGEKRALGPWKALALWLPTLYVCAISLVRILVPSASRGFAAMLVVEDHKLLRATDVHYLVYTAGIFGWGLAGLARLAASIGKQKDAASRRRLASVFAAFLVMAVLMFAFNSLANMLGRRLDSNLSIAVVLGAMGWVSISVLRNKAWKIETLLEVIRKNEAELETRLQEALVNETSAQRTAILALAKLTEYRDNETGRHLERINRYCNLLARRLKETHASPSLSSGSSPAAPAEYLTEEYIDDLCLSSILHDIGKVGIPDSILMKPGKLSDEEFEAIKNHAVIGGDVLKETEALNSGRTFLTIGKHVAYHHHEKWDGSGYPHGLKGLDIPLSARIVAIADVYDALMSERPYKKAFTHEQAAQVIREGRGRHFDPDLVDAFLSIEDRFKSVARA